MTSRQKADLLGMPLGTATHRLRKAVMFKLARALGEDTCFRCDQRIESVDELSIEHKQPWQSAPDPQAAFFDVENIAFSHLSCNCKATTKRQVCLRGHPFTEENTLWEGKDRRCRRCRHEQRNGSDSAYNIHRRNQQ